MGPTFQVHPGGCLVSFPIHGPHRLGVTTHHQLQAAQAYVVAGHYKKAAKLYEEAQHVREAVENFLQAEPWKPNPGFNHRTKHQTMRFKHKNMGKTWRAMDFMP